MATNTQAEKMTATIADSFELFVNIIKDIRDEGLTKITPTQVSFAAKAVRGMNGDELLDAFIKESKHWDAILKKDNKFVTESLEEIYQDTPLDVSIFPIPFKVYSKLCQEGLNGSFDQDDWPVTKDDIGTIWSYFETMVKIACNHVHLRRKPVKTPKGYTYKNPNAYEGLNLQDYVQKFSVKLIDPK